VTVDGEEITLGADEVIITETPREGWAVASEAGASMALDLHLTPELRRAGLAREAIRLIQDARKSSGLEVSDRIELRYHATDDELAAALDEHRALVADEVLATRFGPGEPDWPAKAHEDAGLNLTFWLRRATPLSG
jgi:isoleucyl-tRNA synthetase